MKAGEVTVNTFSLEIDNTAGMQDMHTCSQLSSDDPSQSRLGF